MAEVVGVLASGAGIASLGCQIFESVYKLQEILTAIQDAPQELKIILEEIAIVENILIRCSERPHPPTIDPNQSMARDRVLLHCEAARKHLFDFVSEIDDGIRRSKRHSKWYSFLAVLKRKRIASLVARLERTKSTLAIAQLVYLQSLEVERLDREGNTWLVPVVQGPKFLSSSKAIRKSENDDLHTSYSEMIIPLGIGILVVRCILTTVGVNRPSLEEARVQFRFADWFLRRAIQITSGRESGNFNMTIRTYRLVPADSAIFQACALGDDQAVARLIREGKASPSDMTSRGVTPLHVAAAWLHPSTSKLLLEYGADGSVSIGYCGILWNPLGLAVERAGYYRYFLFPELEKYRPEPQDGLLRMRETMRVLTDHDSIEVHQGYKPGKSGYWNGSRSALHGFRGTSEDFLWLIKRENAFMASKDSDDYIASIVLQQTEMFPNNSFPAAFSQVSNMKSLAKYKDSSGSSLLHYLLATNFGTEPGIWMNGLDIFNFVRTLLEHGADPTARNDRGNTPLMEAARDALRYLRRNGLCWTTEPATEAYSAFLKRWVKALESCHIDLGKYRSREIESGAENFVICRRFEDFNDASRAKYWLVRLLFEQGDAHQELQIKFQFRYKEKKMPGAWPDEFVHN